MNSNQSITGIVLAGGKSTRMGSEKGFVVIEGKTFMSHIIEALQPVVDRIIIVSDNPDYDVFKVTRVADSIKDSGPIAGIYSGLANSVTEKNIVLSCDVPLIKTAVLKELIKADLDNTDVVQVESKGKKMPLVALYKKRTITHFLEQLQQGNLRLQLAVNLLNVKTITLDATLAESVKNINTSEQLTDIRNEHNR